MGRPSEAPRACPWPQWGALAQGLLALPAHSSPNSAKGAVSSSLSSVQLPSLSSVMVLSCANASLQHECVCCSWVCSPTSQVSCPRGAGSDNSSCFCVPRRQNTPTSHPSHPGKLHHSDPRSSAQLPVPWKRGGHSLAWGGEDGVTAPTAPRDRWYPSCSLSFQNQRPSSLITIWGTCVDATLGASVPSINCTSCPLLLSGRRMGSFI